MTYNEFVAATFAKMPSRNPHLRMGQFLMNELYEVRPDLRNQILNTVYDCFYQDSKMVKALEFLADNW